MENELQQKTKEAPCIIYFHEGYSPYLAFSLWQATQSNPEARVILLGDESNRISGIHYEHHLLSDYSIRLGEFRKIYQHFHPGNLEDERRCIERWLFLAEFVRRQGLKNFIFLDSDTLLFENFLVPPRNGQGLMPQERRFFGASVSLRKTSWLKTLPHGLLISTRTLKS